MLSQLLLWTLLCGKILGQIYGSQTLYEGVRDDGTGDTFIKFDAQTSFTYDLCLVGDLEAFSLLLWLKVDGEQSGTFFESLGDFKCSLLPKSVKCDGLQMEIELVKHMWYIFVLQTDQSHTHMWLASHELSAIAEAGSQEYFSRGSNLIRPRKVTIGAGLTGSVRNVMLFNKFLSAEELQVAPFTYLYPYYNLLMMVTLNSLEPRDTQENVCQRDPVSTTGSPIVALDYTATKFCFYADYPMPESEMLPYDFEVFPELQLTPYTLSSTFDQYSSYNRFFTLKMWFQRLEGQASQYYTPDQILFEHEGVMKIKITGSGHIGIEPAEGKLQIFDSQPIPYHLWMYLEVIVNTRQYGLTVLTMDSQTLVTSFDQEWQRHNQVLNPRHEVWFASDFIGIIYAVRYSVESRHPSRPPIVPESLPPVEIVDSSVLLSFSFSKQMRRDVFQFANLARKVQDGQLLPQQYITGTLNSKYRQTLWHEPGKQFKAGSISQPVDFDGITCRGSDSKTLKIDFTSSVSNAVFTAHKIFNSFTAELWFRVTKQSTQRNVIIQLSQEDLPFFQIAQEPTGHLYCYPQYPDTSEKSRLLYTDFNPLDSSWQHVSCSYSVERRQITGVLHKQGLDYVYFAAAMSVEDHSNFPSGQYRVSLGNNQYYGFPGLSLKDLRLWSKVLDSDTIKEKRFNQQPAHSTSLLLYLKLYAPQQPEIVSGAVPSFIGVSWSQETELTLCPLHTFSNGVLASSVCHRDSYRQELKMRVLRSQSVYSLALLVQTAQGDWVFGQYTQLEFTWQYEGLEHSDQTINDSSFKKTSTDMPLVLGTSQVSGRAGYKLWASFDPGSLMLGYGKEFVFRSDFCTSFHDRESKQAWVEKDLDQQRGQNNITLAFEIEECEEAVKVYHFQYLAAEILNFFPVTVKTGPSQLIIEPSQQGQLPLNQYFTVMATAYFKSLDGKELSLSVVYRLKFVSKIQISLTAKPNAVARGQSLTLDSSQYKILNLQQDQVNSVAFTRTWVCPADIQLFCQTTETELVISFDTFLESNLSFWTMYDITVVASPNFVQGDGSESSSATIQVLWVNLAPGDGVITSDTVIDTTQTALFTVDFDEIIEDSVIITWSIEPPISNNLSLLNQRQVNFQPYALEPDTEYTLKALLYFRNQDSELISSATQIFKTLPRPKPGSLQVTPSAGTALVTEFTIEVAGWKQNQTSEFQFFISNQQNLLPITERVKNRQAKFFTTKLPPCSAVAVRVYYEETSSYTQLDFVVNVIYDPTLSPYAVQNTSLLALLTIQYFPDDLKLAVIQESVEKFSLFEDSLAIQLARLQQITLPYRLYDRKQGTLIQTYFEQLVQPNNFDNRAWMMKDKDILGMMLRVESNLLKGCEWLEISRQFSSWDYDEDIVFVTSSVRELLVRFEESYGFLLAEADEFNVTLPAFSVFIGKYSTMARTREDIDGKIGSQIAYAFPLSNACQFSVRQTLTVIAFQANPFLGSHPANQTVVSNSTLYVSYRDAFGYSLPMKCIKDTIPAVFFYKFTPFFVEHVTTCGFYTSDYKLFRNQGCETSHNKSNDRFNCLCAYQSKPVWYTVLEDYFIRPLPPPPVYATFRDWATFIAFAYTSCFTLIGIMYTYGQDLADFKHLRDIKLKKDSELMKQRDLPLDLVSLAQKRQVSLMPYSDKFTVLRYWVLLLTHTHPLLQLRYQLDPQISKLNKFAIFAARLWISMLITFLMLGQAGDTVSPVYISLASVALVAQVLLLASLPNAFYEKLKHKYRLRISPNISKVQSDTKRVKYVDEVVYECDTNLPIRLLFILNSMPLLKANEAEVLKMKFASGKAVDLCEKLIELDKKNDQHLEGGQREKSADDSNQSESEEQGSGGEATSEFESYSYYEESIYVTEKSGVALNDIMTDSDNPKRKQDTQQGADIVDTEISARGTIVDRQVKMGAQRSTTFQSNMMSPTDSVVQRAFERQSTRRGGASQSNEKKQGETVDETIQELQMKTFQDLEQAHSPGKQAQEITESSLDSQVFENERKEFYEANYNLETQAWLSGILIFSVLCFLAPAIYVFVGQEVFTEQLNYVWVTVYFLGQFLAMFIVNPTVCYVVAAYVAKVRASKKAEKAQLVFICRWLRESLIIYEDYQFAVQFQQSRLN